MILEGPPAPIDVVLSNSTNANNQSLNILSSMTCKHCSNSDKSTLLLKSFDNGNSKQSMPRFIRWTKYEVDCLKCHQETKVDRTLCDD